MRGLCHARYAEQQHTEDIDDDIGRSAILTCHVGEAPYIAEADSRACRGEDYAECVLEVSSF